jgi:hypothetical protein
VEGVSGKPFVAKYNKIQISSENLHCPSAVCSANNIYLYKVDQYKFLKHIVNDSENCCDHA